MIYRILRLFKVPLLTLLLIFLSSVPVIAAVYYVDKLHPSASDSNDGSEVSPWKTIRYGVKQLVAGDTLYVKGDGTSVVTYSESTAGTSYEVPCLNPANSGTEVAPITIKAYPGHEKLVKIQPSSASSSARPIGSYGKQWIVWDGFRLKSNNTGYNNGGAWIGGGAHHVTIQNCLFEGTNINYAGDNRQALMVEDSDDSVIRNNLFQGWTSNSSSHIWSNAAIRVYRINGLTVENNEFDDNTNGIDFKGEVNCEDESKWVDVRFNYFHNFSSSISGAQYGIIGFHTTDPSSTKGSWNIKIYQNVFDGAGRSVGDGEGGAKNWWIFNNTFYNEKNGHIFYGTVGTDQYTRWYVWNNIHDTNSSYMFNGQGMKAPGNVIQYSEYNCYYNFRTDPFYLGNWSNKDFNYWRDTLGFDDSDKSITTASSPLADPANGDYRLSSYDGNNPCYSTGRGGSYEDTMGAYITANEVIGLTHKSPKAPTGLEIIK